MYCPVDGEEYREGITRCPEHDVDLAVDPIEALEDRPLLGALDERSVMRLAFRVLLGAAVVYAVAGTAFAVLLSLPSVREAYDGAWDDVLRILQAVDGAAWGVGIAAIAVLAGAVLVRTYSLLRSGGIPDRDREGAPPLSDKVMRVLFALVLLFAALYAVTGVATAWGNAEYVSGVAFGSPEDPSQTHIALTALHRAAYSCAVASFACMAAALVKRTYDRMSAES